MYVAFYKLFVGSKRFIKSEQIHLSACNAGLPAIHQDSWHILIFDVSRIELLLQCDDITDLIGVGGVGGGGKWGGGRGETGAG